jgi:hypothetical protein
MFVTRFVLLALSWKSQAREPLFAGHDRCPQWYMKRADGGRERPTSVLKAIISLAG